MSLHGRTLPRLARKAGRPGPPSWFEDRIWARIEQVYPIRVFPFWFKAFLAISAVVVPWMRPGPGSWILGVMAAVIWALDFILPRIMMLTVGTVEKYGMIYDEELAQLSCHQRMEYEQYVRPTGPVLP